MQLKSTLTAIALTLTPTPATAQSWIGPSYGDSAPGVSARLQVSEDASVRFNGSANSASGFIAGDIGPAFFGLGAVVSPEDIVIKDNDELYETTQWRANPALVVGGEVELRDGVVGAAQIVLSDRPSVILGIGREF